MRNKTLLQEFHDKTKIVLEKDRPVQEEVPITWVKIFFKSYPRFKEIKLPGPKKRKTPLDACILKRESIREFSKKPVTKQTLSDILFYSAGIISPKRIRNWNLTRRAYPSAGARYPLELYVAILNVKGIEKGIYHYNVKKHSLELMLPGNYKKKLYDIILQPMVKRCSALIMISAVFERTRTKYADRAYRYVMLDAGHLAQNMYLKAASLNMGCCTIGGFTDDDVNKLLDLNPDEEAVVYMATIGSRK